MHRAMKCAIVVHAVSAGIIVARLLELRARRRVWLQSNGCFVVHASSQRHARGCVDAAREADVNTRARKLIPPVAVGDSRRARDEKSVD